MRHALRTDAAVGCWAVMTAVAPDKNDATDQTQDQRSPHPTIVSAGGARAWT
jgi:hypothetical protein